MAWEENFGDRDGRGFLGRRGRKGSAKATRGRVKGSGGLAGRRHSGEKRGGKQRGELNPHSHPKESTYVSICPLNPRPRG